MSSLIYPRILGKVDVDNRTIEYDSQGRLRVKDGGITVSKVNGGYRITSDIYAASENKYIARYSSWTLANEIVLGNDWDPEGTLIRLKYGVYASAVCAFGGPWCQIWRNGSPYGPCHDLHSAHTVIVFVEDLTFYPGDRIQLYLRGCWSEYGNFIESEYLYILGIQQPLWHKFEFTVTR